MIRFRSTLAIVFMSSVFVVPAHAQSPAPADTGASENAELLTLSKKIDEQNVKIDLLSQQILRLQQEMEHPKTGALSSPIPPAPESAGALPAASGATHIVARGETLTSIAKMHKVGIEELQKFNHIENDRKLQIGQTLAIPGAQNATPTPAPSASQPNE